MTTNKIVQIRISAKDFRQLVIIAFKVIQVHIPAHIKRCQLIIVAEKLAKHTAITYVNFFKLIQVAGKGLQFRAPADIQILKLTLVATQSLKGNVKTHIEIGQPGIFPATEFYKL